MQVKQNLSNSTAQSILLFSRGQLLGLQGQGAAIICAAKMQQVHFLHIP